MAKTLVFHIGDPKTGTSSIQQVLMDRAFDSPEVTVDYQPMLNAFPLANALFEDSHAHNRERLFGDMAAWLQASQAEVSVISAEMFFRVDPVVMRDALRQHLPEYAETARFIAYVRPHAGRFLSQFVQVSKTGMYWGDMDTQFDRMVAKGGLLYAKRFGAWRQVFGDRFTLRPMLRDALFNRDVVADFLHEILHGAPFTLHPAGAFNESPPLQVLMGLREMHRVLNRRDVPLDLRQAVAQYMVNKLSSATEGRGTKLRLSRDLYDRIAEHCRADAQALDAAFFGAPLMATALDQGAAEAGEAAMSTDVTLYYSPESLAKLRKASNRLAALLAEDGEVWRARFFRDIKQRPDGAALRTRIKARKAELKTITTVLARVVNILTSEFVTDTAAA